MKARLCYDCARNPTTRPEDLQRWLNSLDSSKKEPCDRCKKVDFSKVFNVAPWTFGDLVGQVIERTDHLYELSLGMTLSAYHARWYEIVGIVDQVCDGAEAERKRLLALPKETRGQKILRKEQIAAVEDFINDAHGVAENRFTLAAQTITDFYESWFGGVECDDGEWFSDCLCNERAAEHYGQFTLADLIDWDNTAYHMRKKHVPPPPKETPVEKISRESRDRRERVAGHRESMKCCWPEWDGPKANAPALSGYCNVGVCCALCLDDGKVSYFYCAPLRIESVSEDGMTVVGVINYPREVNGLCERDNGKRIQLDITEVWPPVNLLWHQRHKLDHENGDCSCHGKPGGRCPFAPPEPEPPAPEKPTKPKKFRWRVGKRVGRDEWQIKEGPNWGIRAVKLTATEAGQWFTEHQIDLDDVEVCSVPGPWPTLKAYLTTINREC